MPKKDEEVVVEETTVEETTEIDYQAENERLEREIQKARYDKLKAEHEKLTGATTTTEIKHDDVPGSSETTHDIEDRALEILEKAQNQAYEDKKTK